jgi:hypothetical protein
MKLIRILNEIDTSDGFPELQIIVGVQGKHSTEYSSNETLPSGQATHLKKKIYNLIREIITTESASDKLHQKYTF